MGATKKFLDEEKTRSLAAIKESETGRIKDILQKARELKGLSLEESAELLAIEDQNCLQNLLQTASYVKKEIYGKRMVLFAPLYTGNHCNNNCLYCGFRRTNTNLKRVSLTMDEIKRETESLLGEGHKRLLLLSGESGHYPLKYTMDAIDAVYSVKKEGASIRRVNVEIAPMEVEEFRELKGAKIGTYTCFQETYDPVLYKKYHTSGPKANFDYRLNVMHRAMEGGIDDVGVGILFGLADYRFELLSLMRHAADLEKKFGCGPHTVSVPRLEPAPGAPIANNVPYPVSDRDFKKIVAVIRVSMPYTGIILSTREKTELRNEIFNYGVSQVSAGSRTNPGGYSGGGENIQFSLGDHRSLEEVIGGLIDDGYIPSFCTGCYRKGRVGNDFMDLAKPGLIKQFCMPNGLVSFAEYLSDYASEKTRARGFSLIKSITNSEPSEELRKIINVSVDKINQGQRDIYI